MLENFTDSRKMAAMGIATINRFIRLFDDAFRQLSVDASNHDVELLAMLIHDAMDQGRRIYHTSSHVFAMCDWLNPRQVLAALFHDVVYVQLDGGFPRRARGLLDSVTKSDGNSVTLEPLNRGDAALVACATVFGFREGQELSVYGGLNEFLSAVVAARSLQPYLPMSEILAITACIEATVPFRGADGAAPSPAETLADRVRETARTLDIAVSDADVDTIVRDAVVLGNRDVASFAEPDPAVFLATTWQLIEESNAPLAAVGVYSICEYRTALTRMESFLATVNPDHIFHHYRGTPSDRECANLNAAARKNLDFSTRYMGAKIAAIAVIEALAVATGGDCPVSMMLGDIRSADGQPPARIEHYLPVPPVTTPVDPQMLEVLEGGRKKDSESDLTISPLTAFVYRSLGAERIVRARELAAELFAQRLSARDFLAASDRTMVCEIAKASAQIALSRTDGLLSIAAEL